MLDKIEEAGSDKRTFYEILGGEPKATEVIHDLVETFYDIMDTDSKAATICAMYPNIISKKW